MSEIRELLDGQKKMQECIDGLTTDVKGLTTNVKDIHEKISNIEHQLTHFVI